MSLEHDGFRDQMFRMIGYHVNQISCVAVHCGGWHDHIHLVCGLSRTVTVASLVECVKVETSKWAKTVDHGDVSFAWQAGYAAFSVSQSNLEKDVAYAGNQASHHAMKTFQKSFATCVCVMKSKLMSVTRGIERSTRWAFRIFLGPIFQGRAGPDWMNNLPLGPNNKCETMRRANKVAFLRFPANQETPHTNLNIQYLTLVESVAMIGDSTHQAISVAPIQGV